VASFESVASLFETLGSDGAEGEIPESGVGAIKLGSETFDPARVRGSNSGKLRRNGYGRLAAFESRVHALEALLHPVEVDRLRFAKGRDQERHSELGKRKSRHWGDPGQTSSNRYAST